MKENNMDQLFRDAAHLEKAPQYDNSYWAEMNAILDAKDAKRRGFIYWTIGGTSVLTALLFLLFNLNGNNSIEKYSQENQRELTPIQTDKTSTFFKEQAVNKENTQIQGIEKESMLTASESTLQNGQENTVTNRNAVPSQEGDDNNMATHEISNLNPTAFVGNEVSENESESTESKHSEKTEAINEEISTLSIITLNRLAENNINRLRYSNFKYKPRPSYSLYAKMSGGVMENYKTKRPFESGLFDLSLNFEVNLNNVLLRTGFGSQYTTNSDLIVSQRKKVYDYKVIDVQSDLSYQGLLDIYIPVELGYRFKSTSFGVGVQANYLITTNMNLSIYEDNELVSTERFKGKKNGLNSFSTQGYVWLEQNLTPRISLGLKVGTNISGRIIKNSGYFNNSSTTNPIYGQLSLRYTILR